MLVLIAVAGFVGICAAQNKKALTGSVLEAISKKPVPFAAVTLQSSLLGTNTNENGEFKLVYSEDSGDKRITINCLGFKSRSLALDSAQAPLLFQRARQEYVSLTPCCHVVRALPPPPRLSTFLFLNQHLPDTS